MSDSSVFPVLVIVHLVSSFVVGCMVYQEKQPVLGSERALSEAVRGGIMLCIFLVVATWMTIVR